MGKGLKIVSVMVVLMLVGTGTVLYTLHTGRLIRIDEFSINPKVEINPSRQYHLIVWEHQIPLPWNPGGQADSFASAIDEFQSIYPNIRVDVQWLAWDEGQHKLREALADGHPPDIYGMPHGVRKMSTPLQIPVDPYMSMESREDFLDAALRSVNDNNHLWAWPKWVLPSIWAAHNNVVPDLKAKRSTWNLDEFTQTAVAGKERLQDWGVVLNPYDPSLFVAVMTASTGSNLIGNSGERTWSVEQMTTVLDFFQNVIKSGITDSNADRMSRTRLKHFLSKDALIIAPVNPWLYRQLTHRTDSFETAAIVAVAPPVSNAYSAHADRTYPATVAGYAVFRQEEYKGDDHTKAAMLLAEHLSRRLGPWEASELMAVPAPPTAWGYWHEATQLSDEELNFLIELAANSMGGPLTDAYAHQQQKAIEQVIAEEFPKVWLKVPPEEIAKSIAGKVDGVRAEVPFLSRR